MTPREKNCWDYLFVAPRSRLADRARSAVAVLGAGYKELRGSSLLPNALPGGAEGLGCFLLDIFFLSFPSPPPRLEGGGLVRTSLDGAVERRGVRGWEGGARGGRLPCLLLLHWCLPYGRKQPSVSQGKCFQYRLSDFSRRRRASRERSAGGAPRRPQRARPPRLPPAEDALQHRHQGHGR